MINKKLLSAVLDGKYDLDLQMAGVKNILFYLDLSLVGSERDKDINIYELAHKNLKQWAKLKNVFDIIDWSGEPEELFAKAEELRNEVN